jgi:exodeoxyribonuclease-3
LCDWVAQEKPDVLCLQELKAEPTQIPEACKLADYHVFWHGLRAYSGVSLHVHKNLAGEVLFTHPAFDMESRIVTAQVGNIVFASVYVPNGGKNYPAKLAFLRAMIDWSRRMDAEGRQIVLCGDINIARAEMDVHPRERRQVIGQLPEERALFEEMLGTHLVDVGRAKDPDNANLFSWWAPWRNMRQRNIGWRLDYVLASPSIAARAEACTVLAHIGTSDHAPVVMIAGA